MKSPWQDPAWLATAHAWIEAELERLGIRHTGTIEQPHVYQWSTVLRVPTDAGVVWFKANTDALRHEAALVELLARRRPDSVPPLLARQPDLGWLLMADAGTPLRAVVAEEASLDRWLRVLPQYAGVQLDLEGDVDALLALGVPDLRLGALPTAYERLMDEVDADRRFRDAATRTLTGDVGGRLSPSSSRRSLPLCPPWTSVATSSRPLVVPHWCD